MAIASNKSAISTDTIAEARAKYSASGISKPPDGSRGHILPVGQTGGAGLFGYIRDGFGRLFCRSLGKSLFCLLLSVQHAMLIAAALFIGRVFPKFLPAVRAADETETAVFSGIGVQVSASFPQSRMWLRRQAPDSLQPGNSTRQ